MKTWFGCVCEKRQLSDNSPHSDFCQRVNIVAAKMYKEAKAKNKLINPMWDR